MSTSRLWKKIKSLTILAATGSAAFTSISLYQGNEKFYREIVMPALHFALSAENCQALGLAAAKYGFVPKCKELDGPILQSRLWNIEFPNPIGIAAGLDKNAEATKGLFQTGVGFVEVGTVTPLPQPGNPKPRIFCLSEDQALINRCGFNSKGHADVKINLQSTDKKGIIGVNLGKNKNSQSAEDDYVQGIIEFSDIADYFTINVSSPNTPGLRSLQKKQALENLLDKVFEARKESKRNIPILLKISPDLSLEEKKDIANVVMRKGKTIDGLVVTNTTTSRPEMLQSGLKTEGGGLSGKPLKDLSTATIRDIYTLTKGKIPIIGVGGVSTGQDAYEKIKAGASLVQVYTSLAHEGPPVIGKIKRELKELLIADNYSNIQQVVGVDNSKS